jgi:arylsulfatase A-like enzyme
VLLLIADNLGWRDLGCYGSKDAISPNTDELAKGGVRFTNAFVTASSCSPSRTTIITGQAPHSTGTLGLTHIYPEYQLPSKTPTMPEALRRAGYHTAIDGKWHVAPFKNIGAYGYKEHLNRTDIRSSDKAREFISRSKNAPFYLEMNFMQTHRPSPNHAFRQHPDFPVDPKSIRVPEYWSLPDWPEIREDVAAYYSQAAHMDAIIGEVLDHLENQGLADNTLVVYVSDNGPMYPGGIGMCYDRSIATPLILRWPAALKAGAHDSLVSTIDIMPTVLAAAGIAAPPPVQGASLLPAAKGEESGVRDAVFAEMTYHVLHTPMRAIRTKQFKYIENLNDTPVGLDMCEDLEWAKRVAKLPEQPCCRPRPPEELYDIQNDPNELINLADNAGYAEVKADLIKELHAWRSMTADPVPLLSDNQ